MSGHDYDPYDTNHDGKLDFNERCAKEIDEEAIFREMQDAHKKVDQRNSAFANKNMSDPSHRPHHVGTGQLAEKSETQRRIEEVRREREEHPEQVPEHIPWYKWPILILEILGCVLLNDLKWVKWIIIIIIVALIFTH